MGRSFTREYTSIGGGVSFVSSFFNGEYELPQWFELPDGGDITFVDGSGTSVSFTDLLSGQRYAVELRSITSATGKVRVGSNAVAAAGGGGAGGGGPSVSPYGDEFVPTNGQTAFTLSAVPLSEAAVEMKINGLAQDYGVDFTITGKAVTYAGSYSLVTTDHVRFDYLA